MKGRERDRQTERNRETNRERKTLSEWTKGERYTAVDVKTVEVDCKARTRACVSVYTLVC